MDKSTRASIGVAALVLAVLAGVNLMVDNERSGNWLLLTIVFGALALFFFWWMGADERRTQHDAEREAREKIRLAEEQVRQARNKVLPSVADQSATVAATTAMPDVTPAPAPVAEVSPVSATPPVSQTPTAVVAEVPAVAQEITEVVADDHAASAGENVVIPAPHAVEVPAAPTEVTPMIVPDEMSVVEAEFAPLADTILRAPEVLEQPFQAASPAVEENPASKVVGAPSGDDDLTLLEGIGPVYRDALHRGGVLTFAALARMDKEAIDALLKSVGARRSMTTTSWQEQAVLAAQGDWDGLKTLQASMTGGRK